jgi:mannose-6-phosphate isomerase-like protein (cupin superfamily)
MTEQIADDRPWGRWEILLDESYCKVKRIIVKPGHRLSLQKHFKREEFWTIVKGVGTITIDGRIQDYPEKSVAHIPAEAAHRIENKTDVDLVFIEVQCGSYFGEDDIVRFEDDYGRE